MYMCVPRLLWPMLHVAVVPSTSPELERLVKLVKVEPLQSHFECGAVGAVGTIARW